MLGFIFGLMAGTALAILLMLLFLKTFFFRIVFQEQKSPFSFTDTCDALRLELEKNNWKVPQVHDLQETMFKYGKQVNQVRVYEICQPELAYEILARDGERIVSSLMPCRIAVYEKKNGKTYASVMNGSLMAWFGQGVVRRVLRKASAEVQMIIRKALGN